MNAQQTTSTTSSARNCRSSYGGRRDSNVVELKNVRRLNSRTVERVAEARLPTDFGEFRILGYRSLNSIEEFVVLVQGELRKDRASFPYAV